MELTYSLDEDDVIALTEFRIHYVPSARLRMRVRRWGYLVGFGLVGLGSWILGYSVILVIVWFLLAIVLFLLYPAYHRWNVRTSVRKAYQDEKMRATLRSRTVRLTNEGMEEVSALGELKLKWDAIEHVAIVPSRAFVTLVRQPPAMVISDRHVTAGDYNAFVAAFQEHMRVRSHLKRSS